MNSAVNPFTIAVVVLTLLYLPLVLVFYWLTHVRRQVSAGRQAIRTKELAFFFRRTLDEQWSLGAHLLMCLLPSLVLALGGTLAAISLMTLLETQSTVYAFGIPVQAVERYISPVFFGFLGAYLFMLQVTLRRYLDDDLGIDTHVVITVRLIMALIVSFVAGFLLPAADDKWSVSTVLVYGAAFIFGVMPERGFETLYRIVVGWLGDLFRRKDSDRLDDLGRSLGFDRLRIARLNVENIKTVEDMAYVEIERLAQKTRFDLQAIFHWVDRAILYSQLRDSHAFRVLEANGIRAFTSFETVYRDSEARESIKAQVAKASAADQEKGGSVAMMGLDLDVVYAAMSRIPNTSLVRLFKRYKAMQTTGAFEAANRAEAYEKMERYDQAVAEYGAALVRNPLDPTLLTRRGRVQSMVARQQMRSGAFAEGRDAFERALHDFQGALDILPSSWMARLQRAIMLLDQVPYLFDRSATAESLDRTAGDLQEAIKHNADELEIVNWLGLTYLAQGQHQQALVLLTKALKPGLYQAPAHARATADLVLARALIEQARKQTGGEREESLRSALSHIVQAQGLMPHSSLLFYVQALYYHLGNPGSKQVDRFLELALSPVEGGVVPAEEQTLYSTLRLHTGADYACDVYELWGELSEGRGEIDTAVACYTQALALDLSRTTAYVRRGALYERLGDLDAAIADYCFLIDTMGYETPDVYLARARARSIASRHRSELGVQAERDIERAIALAPDHPAPLIAWGHWLRLPGDYQGALETYDRAHGMFDLLRERDGIQLDQLERDLWIGRGFAYCGLPDSRQARDAFRHVGELVKGQRSPPSSLQIGWGVLYALDSVDFEARMNARDAFVRLIDQATWSGVNAADLRQMNDALAALTRQAGSMDRDSEIRLEIARIRAAALSGDPDVIAAVEALRASIAKLPGEMRRANLSSLLSNIAELRRYV
ncbi:MAG: tetratricopeptide repeat protein [Anaerolineae bacterium]|nr:tetratricopeptide repeat protein [Anaerolineae bacterium]